MDVEYTGRQATITKKLKLQTEAGLARIVKILGNAGNVHVILATDKYRQKAEVTIQTRNQKLVSACESTEMVLALRDALVKIEQQAIRHKKKKMTIKRHGKSDTVPGGKIADQQDEEMVAAKPAAAKTATKSSSGRKAVPMLVHSFPSHSPLTEPHVARSTDGVALRPMTLEEAVKEAAFRDRDVFVFHDHGGQAMVLHRKRDGKMELIEVP
ncbi:MAG: ribosome-associated translation inhibitor RaiA [Edaphobacter sp.]|uniref:ribosome hibernation-promoting factor, HPF/YfiA family n=1 Tax=Edaphobacter sp. TaxID=1934404 RepID=UPI002980F0EB|nr:ribosome-associated translation inhibitor RaiA [Edaphobacter sp.]MDW5267141.1 ribosome-associated translation inhibitor RaiA [Edaphobacter sp.]